MTSQNVKISVAKTCELNFEAMPGLKEQIHKRFSLLLKNTLMSPPKGKLGILGLAGEKAVQETYRPTSQAPPGSFCFIISANKMLFTCYFKPDGSNAGNIGLYAQHMIKVGNHLDLNGINVGDNWHKFVLSALTEPVVPKETPAESTVTPSIASNPPPRPDQHPGQPKSLGKPGEKRIFGKIGSLKWFKENPKRMASAIRAIYVDNTVPGLNGGKPRAMTAIVCDLFKIERNKKSEQMVYVSVDKVFVTENYLAKRKRGKALIKSPTIYVPLAKGKKLTDQFMSQFDEDEVKLLGVENMSTEDIERYIQELREKEDVVLARAGRLRANEDPAVDYSDLDALKDALDYAQKNYDEEYARTKTIKKQAKAGQHKKRESIQAELRLINIEKDAAMNALVTF